MDGGSLGMKTSAAMDPTLKPASVADMRRKAWAGTRDSFTQASKSEQCDPQNNGDSPRHPGGAGQPANSVPSWLSECRNPHEASLDDQSASPTKGALRNGCSFEDDLLLGAEANDLQSTNIKTETCFNLPADQKRSQYKEKGRSMNSTGSGKSSNVSSVSELLDLYEEDPEEILLNLGFGREEPDLSARIPNRFFSSVSSARGIDFKVYLGAQMQRMELENPNYALTSRFRQLEVFTTVANGFIELLSQVSGQPAAQISSREQGEEGKERGGGESAPARRNTALNAVRVLKRNVSRRNLLASVSSNENSPNQQTQLTPAPENPKAPEPDSPVTDSDAQAKRRINSSVPLATVTEETSGDGETERLMDGSSEQSKRAESADQQPAEEEGQLASVSDKTPSTLAPPQLAQLRTENADSFDMEEIQTNDDEALPGRTSRTTDLSRTVSQQSDSSGFAEEPSVDFNSYLKVQESCDSCDSETTVTSHPSQDVATPHALDQPTFDLPDGKHDEAEPGVAAEHDGRENSGIENPQEENPEPVPLYTVHQLPFNRLTRLQQQQQEASTETQTDGTQTEPQLQHDSENIQNQPEPERTENRSHLKPPILQGSFSFDSSSAISPVLRALNRVKQSELVRSGSQLNDTTQRRGAVPMQRSSSLPSSLISPRVISSVRVEFGQGQTSCTPPRYSYKYAEESVDSTKEEEEEEEEQPSCLSTLIINPPKPIPHYLTRSSYSLHSSSPPPDPSGAGRATSWSTQSVPNLSLSQQQANRFSHSLPSNQNPAQMFPNPSSSSVFSDHYNPYFFNSNPHLQHLYANPPMNYYSSLTSLHHPSTSPHSSFSNLHHAYGPYHAPFAPPFLAYHTSPNVLYPHSAAHYPPPGQEPGFHSGLPHSAPASFAAHGSLLPGHSPSSTEMQLRRVLHEIRGTVQSINQTQDDAPPGFDDHRGRTPIQQSLAELQQKKHCLNMFRNQMTELEMSIMRQQAQVYKHMSRADRCEAEQLQSLRSSVRDELQELEQQLDDRVIKLMRYRALRRGSSVDSMSSSSALRAMEPMSELLREQYFLQSELNYDGRAPSTEPSTRSSSPARQSRGVYRASISITPAPPSRPGIHNQEEEQAESGRDSDEAEEENVGEEEESERFNVNNLQQLIQEIRDSVAQEVRREIYSELLAAASSPIPARPSPP